LLQIDGHVAFPQTLKKGAEYLYLLDVLTSGWCHGLTCTPGAGGSRSQEQFGFRRSSLVFPLVEAANKPSLFCAILHSANSAGVVATSGYGSLSLTH
jgi:hypothetical protein